MIIWLQYDKNLVKVRRIGENDMVIFNEINKIGWLVENWSNLGYVTIQRFHYFLKYTSHLSQLRLPPVSMIIWSDYDKRVVRMQRSGENGMVIPGQNKKIGRVCNKWKKLRYVKMQRIIYLKKYISHTSPIRLSHVSMMIWWHYYKKHWWDCNKMVNMVRSFLVEVAKSGDFATNRAILVM